ncbi:MAG: hypothetical protein WA071_27995 [Undibacterium umbellatum]|uniref:hypothetical protein n=1 Tax=Undibacterium umbellatum TaxID=2762300 RepID=UPI003BB582BF
MKTPLQVMEERLEAKQQPTYDEVEAALHQALSENSALMTSVKEMASWMSRLVYAHISLDDKGIKATLDAFMAERVKIVQAAATAVH